MDIQQIFLIASSILAFCSPAFYVWDILKGKAQPHRTTRLVILIITALSTAALLAQHNTTAVWLAGIGLFQSTIIFALSLKYGVGGSDKLDMVCLVIAAFGIAIWKITNDPVLALYASIAADFTGFFPTLVKTFRFPKTESLLYFLVNLLAVGFNVLAMKVFDLQNVSYPLYLFLANLAMVVFMVRKKRVVEST